MADLASLIVRLVAETRGFRDGLDRAAADLAGFGRAAAGILGKVGLAAGAAVVAAATGFAAMAKSAIDAADSMNDLAKATGISTEVLSQLEYAAEQSGSNLEMLVTGFRKFSANIADAAAKAGTARDAFNQIGVAVKDAAGNLKPTEQLLLDVAEQFSKYKDGAAKAAFAQDMFGKSGAAMIPFLNEGRAGIEKLMKAADDMGLTLAGKTAQAADDFNDTLNELNKQVQGLVLQATSKLLPTLLDIAKAFAEFVREGKDARGIIDALAIAFKGVLWISVAIADVFSDVGRLWGAVFAAQMQALQGHFKQAADILKEAHKDGVAAEERTSKLLDAIWNGRAESYNKALENYKPSKQGASSRNRGNRIAQGIKENFPTATVKKGIDDGLEEIEIKLKKITLPEDFYGDMERETRTSTQKTYATFEMLKYKLDLLFAAGMDPADYAARLAEGYDELRAALDKGAVEVEETVTELNEYQVQAARNTQDIIANTFEQLATGGDISAKSILKSFGMMIIQLAAQAAAANLAGKLFGEAGGGTAGSTGWLGAIMGAVAGGSRDSGGRGRGGVAYKIGTGAQPEMFIPDRPGTFVPAGMGGTTINNNFSVSGDAPIARRTQLQIAAAASLGVQRANRRNN